MFWRSKKVLVTGSEGFIGSHLAERLVELGAEVRAMVLYNSFNHWGWLETLDNRVKNSIEIFTGDVRDYRSVSTAMEGREMVFHLAALIAIPYSYRAPYSYVETNITGSLNVLESARERGMAKVVHTSTSEVYGSARYVPIDEKHPLQGQSPYSASKIGADKLAESYYLSFGLPVSTIRPFNTYGPRQSARAVIPTVISQVLSGRERIKLGALSPTRDFNYVKDTVEGFVKVAESEKSVGKVINIGSGREISIGDLALMIARLAGREVELVCDEERLRPENSEVSRLLCDSGQARALTGWTPAYTLEAGLKETIDWVGSNLDRYKAEIYNV